MSRLKILQISAVIGFALAARSTSLADLYWAGTSGGDTTAPGGGTWDNVTDNWANSDPGTGTTAWVAGGNANFGGSPTGTVYTGDNLNIGSATFKTFGYTLENDSYTVNVTGAGLTSGTNSTAVTNNSILNFTNSSTASNPSQFSIAINNSGTLTFKDSSDAGNASITNTGTLYFQGSSGAANAIINNNGIMDISGLTSSSLSIGALNSSSGITLGNKTLNVANLGLDGNGGSYNGAEFNFTLGTTSAEVIANSETNLDAPNTGGGPGIDNGYQTQIDITAGAGYAVGLYTLIDDTGGTLDLSDYVLGTLPGSGYLELADGGTELDLNLTAVPEVSSFLIPILGAAALFWLRRRGSVTAEMPAIA